MTKKHPKLPSKQRDKSFFAKEGRFSVNKFNYIISMDDGAIRLLLLSLFLDVKAYKNSFALVLLFLKSLPAIVISCYPSQTV